MSGDEIFALIISAVIGVVGWMPWIGGMLTLGSTPRRWLPHFLAAVFPLLSAAIMFVVLASWSSHDVRSNRVYLFFYMAMWFGWTGAANRLLSWLELNCRDDALERCNVAAAIAVGGAMLGITLCFAGGNIGDGPGWWVVVFSGGLSSATLLLLWMAGHSVSRIAETVTVDRDIAAGWRTLGFFVGAGLILGRAVAGDWASGSQTVVDFVANGWPTLIVWGIAVAMDVIARPSSLQPVPNYFLFGVLPCVLYVGIGIGAVILRGPW